MLSLNLFLFLFLVSLYNINYFYFIINLHLLFVWVVSCNFILFYFIKKHKKDYTFYPFFYFFFIFINIFWNIMYLQIKWVDNLLFTFYFFYFEVIEYSAVIKNLTNIYNSFLIIYC